MKLARTLILAGGLLLAGCSFIDLAYNNAPGFVAGEIDDALDLTDQQLSQLEQGLEAFFAWHREEELARYHHLLDDAAAAAVDGVSADEFMAVNEGVRRAYRRSMAKAIDTLGDLALTLTPQQIDAFDRYYRETQEKYIGYLEMSAQQREIYRVERSLDRLQKWFGSFDDYLEDKASARLRQLPDMYEPWLRFRERRHEAILQALREATDKGLTRAQLKTLVLDPETDYAREFEPQRTAYWRAYAKALEDISEWTNRGQRQKVSSRLRNYARTVERLSQSS